MKQFWETQPKTRKPNYQQPNQIDPKINQHWTPENQSIVREFYRKRDKFDPNVEEMNKTNSSGNNSKLTEETFNKIKDQLLNQKAIYDLKLIQKGKLYRQGGMNGFLNPKMEQENFQADLYIMGTSNQLQRELSELHQSQLQRKLKERQANKVYYIYINTNLNKAEYCSLNIEEITEIFQRAQERSPEEENVIYSLSRRIILMIEKYVKLSNKTSENVIQLEDELVRLSKEVANVLQDAVNQTIQVEPVTIEGIEETIDIYFIPLYMIKQQNNQVQQQNV